MRELRGKVVVITGASAGIGRAIAHRFARAKASIGLIARDREALADVEQEVESLGGRALAVPADVADAQAVFAAADAVAQQLGPIDVWINDAMVTMFAPVWEITPEEFRRVTEVTYLGFVHGTMAAMRHMRPRNSGVIIQIGSALAYRGIPLQSAYCGAKHAMRGFTNSLRAELIHTGCGIRLSMIELPAVNTPQFDWARTHMAQLPRPVPPIVQPEVIAQAVFRAAIRPEREYWVGWSTLKAILANMMLPGLLDRYLARVGFTSQAGRLPVPPWRKDNLMVPVRELHRTRGRFGAVAYDRAPVIVGRTARLAPLVCGALTMALFGFLLGRLRGTGGIGR